MISCHKAGDIGVAIQPFRGMEAHLTDTICAAIQKHIDVGLMFWMT